jgi:CheY-like chemotaxis protein
MKNIYLADDDADDRMFFEDALKQLPIPTQLTLSNDGLELMCNLETVIPDVIFLDLNMPRKNGFQCLEEIRSTPNLKDIPIVIFSTTANEDAVNKTYQLGANYYICKPHSFELLVKAIETVLTLEILLKSQPPKENFILTIV